MRPFIIAAAVAVGLVALWAAVLPLTAKPAAERAAATSPAITKALFLCRSRNGLDQGCVRALAKALALDIEADAPARVSDQRCQMDKAALAALGRHD
jgi:hypothetical protein